MIDKRSLEFDVYEYLDYCKKNQNIRGVGVITDKQFIFYSQILKDDYKTHPNIAMNIEKEIHPNSNRDYWGAYRDNNAYVYAVGANDFIINFPENKELSIAQSIFISELLDQIDKYNMEVNTEDKKVKIVVTNTGNHLVDFEINDTFKIREALPKMITLNSFLEKEKIVGKTLKREQIKTNLIYCIGLENCTKISDLYEALLNLFRYNHDDYYHDFVVEIFPDFSKINNIMKYINILIDLKLDDKKIQNINFDNVGDVLYINLSDGLKNIFKDKNSYFEVRNFISYINRNLSENDIEKILPNFNLFLKCFDYIIPVSDNEKTFINEAFEKVSTYEELVKIVFKIGYDKKNKDLEFNKMKLISEEENLSKNQQNKRIISHKAELNGMIVKRCEQKELLYSHNSLLQKYDDSIKFMENEKKYYDGIIEKKSSSFFKKVINNKLIKNAINSEKVLQIEIEGLKGKRLELVKEIEQIKQNIKSLEGQFKMITQLNFFPDSESKMLEYYDESNLKDEFSLKKNIIYLQRKIAEIEEQLAQMIKLNLVSAVDENVNDDVSDFTPKGK